jgi:hypothetical protein
VLDDEKSQKREREREAKVCGPMIQLPVDWRFSHPDVPLSLCTSFFFLPSSYSLFTFIPKGKSAVPLLMCAFHPPARRWIV